MMVLPAGVEAVEVPAEVEAVVQVEVAQVAGGLAAARAVGVEAVVQVAQVVVPAGAEAAVPAAGAGVGAGAMG